MDEKHNFPLARGTKNGIRNVKTKYEIRVAIIRPEKILKISSNCKI